MFNDPRSASAMPGMVGAGFGNMLAPAMEANDEMRRRRQHMAQLLMQGGQPQQPMQPMMQPTVDQGGVPMGGGSSKGVDGSALGSALGQALNDWLNRPQANTTGMGVQAGMGGLY